MLCTNTAFFGTQTEKNQKTNPWGLKDDPWSIFTYCNCFKKNHIAPIDVISHHTTPILPIKIISDNDEQIS